MKILNMYSANNNRYDMSKQMLIQEAQQEVSKESLVAQLTSTLHTRDKQLALNS